MGPDYPSGTREHYRSDEVVESYDRAFRRRLSVDRLVARSEMALVARLLDLAAPAGASCLDVPAGTGKLTPQLRGRFARYVAADVSPVMLRRISPEVERVVADVTRLPFGDGSLEAVVCLRLLHRVPAAVWDAALVELGRVGSAAVVCSYASEPAAPRLHRLWKRITGRPDPRVEVLTPAAFAARVRAAGLAVVADLPVLRGLSGERLALLRP